MPSLLEKIMVNKPSIQEDEKVEIKEYDSSHLDKGWHSVIYNDDVNSMEHVVEVLQMCGKSIAEAEEIMMIAHTKGIASVHHEPLEKGEKGRDICETITEIIRENGIQSETLFIS